ncbi:hypothetical protein AALO_G00301570 [Alosa alosa]|uniref:Uncharacterized protein n=1 Tax=Alosa alosa TaxID=278164 RepID=A0AAV6FJA4_9TELE|nr:uncharacterized protein si:ch211-119e14.1 [Alosa alosa]XP_048092440.1 uncharacterized protein si:ch211-119e14.1 [Alosa alosa]XP_048092441.1 uncharacterized protein si:ch211-119e14.1 [Alosa alosa]KAG5261237.1 hypothetical protein AALO_G00301570 [Alosa alosa]
MTNSNTPGTTIGVLVALFIILFGLLVYLYRRLNRDTENQYTVRNIVLSEGGLRDRVRSGVVAMEARLGIHLWPRPRPSSEEEEVIGDSQPATNEDVETGQNERSGDVAAEDKNEHADEGDDSEDDYSSMGGTDLRERAKLMKDVDEGDDQQEGERRRGGEGKEEEGEREVGGLLVNLQEFSSSAIWSEEKKDENEDVDLTAL